MGWPEECVKDVRDDEEDGSVREKPFWGGSGGCGERRKECAVPKQKLQHDVREN